MIDTNVLVSFILIDNNRNISVFIIDRVQNFIICRKILIYFIIFRNIFQKLYPFYLAFDSIFTSHQCNPSKCHQCLTKKLSIVGVRFPFLVFDCLNPMIFFSQMQFLELKFRNQRELSYS